MRKELDPRLRGDDDKGRGPNPPPALSPFAGTMKKRAKSALDGIPAKAGIQASACARGKRMHHARGKVMGGMDTMDHVDRHDTLVVVKMPHGLFAAVVRGRGTLCLSLGRKAGAYVGNV